jgi:hypothetical protein
MKGGCHDAFRSVLGNKREYACRGAAPGGAEAHFQSVFPPKGVNMLRWDMTPDLWGIAILEAENAWDVFSAVGMWLASSPGFIRMTKIAPATPVQEAIPREGELLKKLAYP